MIGLVLSAWQYIEKTAAYRRAVNAEQEQSRLRHEAEAARRLAEAQALVAARQAYAADMNLVAQALAVNNLGRAQELLNRHRPEGIAKIQSPVAGGPHHESLRKLARKRLEGFLSILRPGRLEPERGSRAIEVRDGELPELVGAESRAEGNLVEEPPLGGGGLQDYSAQIN